VKADGRQIKKLVLIKWCVRRTPPPSPPLRSPILTSTPPRFPPAGAPRP
jgi:hypothetical protein